MAHDKTREEGVLPLDVVQELYPGFPFDSYFVYAQNLIKLNQLIAAAALLAPAFVRIEGLVLLEENVKTTFESGDSVFDIPHSSSARSVQRYWNMMTADQFYFVELDVPYNTLSNTKRLMHLVRHFWSNRLREVFSDETFVFEISETGFFDEDSLCLTFYQESASC